MASKKTAAKTAPAKTTEPANTSAPKAGENAEVSAAGAGQPAPNAETTSAPSATPTVTTSETPPGGGDGVGHGVFPPAAGGNGEQIVSNRMTITAKTEGFRRSGRAWSKSAETVNAADFTPAQIAALLAEPMLDVVVVTE